MNKFKYPIRSNGVPYAFSLNDMKVEIDGMKVIIEKKVALLPVDITEKKNENKKPIQPRL